MKAPPHVVLVGGGHTHLQTLARLAQNRTPPCRLCVVVDEPVSLYSGMVPGFVAGQYGLPDLAIDVASLARAANARVVTGRAIGLDAGRQEIALADGSRLPYDIASFDIGATVAGLDLPGVRAHALPVRPIGAFVRQIGALVEPARGDKGVEPVTVAVVGAGAGGVELAFTTQARLTRATGTPPRVLVLEAGDRILPGLPASLARRAHRRAVQRGVEIRLHQRVTSVTADAVQLADGNQVRYDRLLWVAGAASQAIFRESGVATDERGFVRVRSTLQFQHHDNLFATGDCAALIDHPTTPKAGVYAVRQGPVLTHNLRAANMGTPLKAFAPQRDFLTLLTLGDGTALGSKWGRTVEGRWVMRLKDWIDRRWVRRFSFHADSS